MHIFLYPLMNAGTYVFSHYKLTPACPPSPPPVLSLVFQPESCDLQLLFTPRYLPWPCCSISAGFPKSPRRHLPAKARGSAMRLGSVGELLSPSRDLVQVKVAPRSHDQHVCQSSKVQFLPLDGFFETVKPGCYSARCFC